MRVNNPDPLLITIARFVRDLLQYDEELISIGRNNEELENATEQRIAVDSVTGSSLLSTSKKFDGDAEKMHLSTKNIKSVTISFYGNNAYDVVDDFVLMQKTQLSYELQKQYEIAVKLASEVLDVKLLTGSTYVNRLDVTINVVYNKKKSIDTLRIEDANTSILFDK